MLAALARPSKRSSVNWSPLDERWYGAIGGSRSDSGVSVVPESALGIAVVFRAINVRAHAVASVPLVIYKRLDDDGKEKAREHPAYNLLHDRPNAWMTSYRWRHLVMVQSILWGDHYSEIMPGRGGIGGLVPLNPDTTRVVDQLGDGRLVYVTRDQTQSGFGPERRLLQDDVFHKRGFSIDGKKGLPLPKLARNAMGLALSAEKHGSMFLKKGARLSGVLSTDSPMTEPVRKENEAAWQRQYGGTEGTGGTPVLTGGLKFNPISANNKDSQWLEARTFQVEEMLRFIGVPGVLCGYADKTSTYASAEQFFLSFVSHTVRPDTEDFAQELNGSVVTESPTYFADFILEGLLKGDIATRYKAHQLAIGSGWKSRNEVRVEESYNRGPAELDAFLEPLNMVEAGAERDDEDPAPRPAPQPPARDNTSEQYAAIARRSVERLARKEVVAITGGGGKLGAAARFAGNTPGWREWLVSFYAEHASTVAADLGVTLEAASDYCTRQRLRFDSLDGASETAEADSIAALMRLIPGDNR